MPLPAIDIDRVAVLLTRELAAFEVDFNRTITEVQYLRAPLVAWFALFAPEVFSGELRTRWRYPRHSEPPTQL